MILQGERMGKSSVAFKALALGLWRRRGLTAGLGLLRDKAYHITKGLHGELGLQSTLGHSLVRLRLVDILSDSYAIVVHITHMTS